MSKKSDPQILQKESTNQSILKSDQKQQKSPKKIQNDYIDQLNMRKQALKLKEQSEKDLIHKLYKSN